MNRFLKNKIVILAAVISLACTGCSMMPAQGHSNPSGESGGSASVAVTPIDPEPESALAPLSERLTPDVIQEIYNRTSASKLNGTNCPGGIGEFLSANPDFLLNQANRVMFSGKDENGNDKIEDGGEQARLLLDKGIRPDEDLLNRERLAKFVENYKAGTADEIAVISTGDPIPVWITIFSYDGSSYTISSYGLNDSQPRSETVEELVETEKEWIMGIGPDWRIRYPRYGYEAIALSDVSAEASQEQAQAAMEPVMKSLYPAYISSIRALDPIEVDGYSCYVFNGIAENGQDFGITFAVAKDLSRYYEVEHANGDWMLCAQVKAQP